MVPPGWNVTEPLRIAIQAIRTLEAIHHAPEEAKDFRSNIDSFDASVKGLQSVLKQLQPVVETGRSLDSPPDTYTTLEKELMGSRDCITRCEEFSKRYNAL